MLVSHLDVVGAAPELFTPQIRDGRLYGRGSNDMKAGLAAAVIAAERLAAEAREAGGRSPLSGDLLVAGCADEEWESFGAEALVARYRPTAAILPERTDFDVTVEHGGFTWFAIESTGVEAAGAEPEKGVDAIALLGPVLAGIAALDRDLEARPRAPYGRGSIHAATIEGGTQLPAYPGVCRLGVERCLISGESVTQSQGEIEALLAAARAADPRFAASSRLVVGREPVTLRRDDPVVLALVAAATAELGGAPRVRGDIGWADSGIFAEAGIPCAQFGPIGGGEHTSGEWVDVASVGLVARVLEAAARRYCG
jgi:acetylornithine deacetylase/succinyl-diaminopimelate desuccinylase-like protein